MCEQDQQQQQQRWATLATTLRRTSARAVDLFVRVPPVTERNNNSAASCEWKVWLEVAYARRARVCGRVDLWLEHDILLSKVQSVSAFLHERVHGDDETLLGDLVAVSERRELLARKTHGSVTYALADSASVDDALARALQQIVLDLAAFFHANQVQTLLASSSQQAQFEFELLQHRVGLDVLVTTTDGQLSNSLVTFMLPLFAANSPSWDMSAVCNAADASLLFLPDAFERPNIVDEAGAQIPALSVVYALDSVSDRSNESTTRRALAISANWPASLALSSRVVYVPMPSQLLSSIDALSACEQSFAAQWNQRKAFIRELRQHSIVLEYDAVDFARVFFMVQEQRDERAPLQIVLLALEFPPEYFLTLCPSDLQLSLLDGDDASNAPVTVRLRPSPSAFETNGTSKGSAGLIVHSFLAAVHDALVRRFDAPVTS